MSRNTKGLGSEHYLQERLRLLMHKIGWHTEKMHGSVYQKDLPDLYCLHPTFGPRWVEVKKPSGKLSQGQIRKFIKWAQYGTKVWILTGPDDYALLMKPSNLPQWLQRQVIK